MAVRIARSVAEAESMAEAWDDLAAAAAEKNPFYERWFLIPGWKLLAETGVWLASVWDERDEGRLIGLFPLQLSPRYRRLRIRHFSLWQHPYCFLCTPLLRRGSETQAMHQFLHWSERAPGHLVEFNHFGSDGPFAEQLQQVCAARKRLVDEIDVHSRPCIRCSGDAQTYLERVLGGQQRKKLAAKSRKLAGLGTVRTEVLDDPRELGRWLEWFVALEASGWKGRRGTAFANDSRHRLFFESIVRGGFARGQLILLMLRLGDMPLAMTCLLRSERTLFSFKIAYNEDFAPYSPGLLLMLEATTHVLNHYPLAMVDSCAVPGHAMFVRLWKDERSIRSLVINDGGLAGKALVAGMLCAKSLKHGLGRRIPFEVESEA